jgi:dipeptidyl aminopeptidase/acylaminoacyl peptidase
MNPVSSTLIIPRQVLFGNPDKAMVKISPDGTKIGYLAPVEGVLNVWVGPADDPAAARPVTKDTYRGIRFYSWAYTNEHVLYIQDKGGDENWRLYSVDLGSGEIQDLTPIEGVQARVQGISHKYPGEILVGLNDRDPTLHDLYRVDIETSERHLIQENPEFAGYLTDDDYNVRFALRVTPDGGSEILRAAGDGNWELFAKIEMEDMITTNPVGFDKTGQTLYMTDSRGRNTAALVALDTASGAQILLAEDARSDVDDLMIHPTEKNVQAVAFMYERKRWQVLDETIADDLATLRTVADGEVEVASRTLDDKTWIVVYVMDDGPLRYYRYDRQARKAQFLFTNRVELEDAPLAKMHPVAVRSRDGLDLVSYYTLPLGSDGDGDGLPDEPLPMVLFVHGGPWGRDRWGYDPWHQWMANRGYVVLSVNFRASTGLGKAFVNAGDREWGAKMHDDLIDAVDWAIEAGIADPERVAIMGGSYGGYATLAGLTFTPDKFACGVDIVGPSNLVTLLETIPPYWKPQMALFTTRVGDHRTEEGRAFLSARSPLTYADRIQRPLLIGQGANDPRVKQAESDQIVQAMQEKGIPVTYVLYPDEGHGFARPENRMSFNAVAEAFLAECLGGRYEPVGDDFEGSTLTVPVGVEGVPGLGEALEGRSQTSSVKRQT